MRTVQSYTLKFSNFLGTFYGHATSIFPYWQRNYKDTPWPHGHLFQLGGGGRSRAEGGYYLGGVKFLCHFARAIECFWGYLPPFPLCLRMALGSFFFARCINFYWHHIRSWNVVCRAKGHFCTVTKLSAWSCLVWTHLYYYNVHAPYNNNVKNFDNNVSKYV